MTLGTFDGVHLGHQEVIQQLIQAANSIQGESVVLTFYPHPRNVLKSGEPLRLLNSMDEKIELLDQLGLDHLVIHPFDTDFSQLTAEEFVKQVLVDAFGIRKIIVGHDHRFGKNRTANFDDLVTFGKIYGFEVEQISAHLINDMAVSSTKIRHSLNTGNIVQANAFLGYNYRLSGKVIQGKQLGRTIGFPTANIKISDFEKLIPENGSYVVKINLQDQSHYGMMNIGFNPTIGNSEISLEVYLFDFDSDIYGQNIQVEFIDRLRDEMKFDSVDALKLQLKNDEIRSREILSK